MRGRLSVQSPLTQKSELKGGPGSTFTVELDFETAEDDMPRVVAAPGSIRKYQGEHKRLLIADDDSANLNFLVDALEPLGFDIARTGKH